MRLVAEFILSCVLINLLFPFCFLRKHHVSICVHLFQLFLQGTKRQSLGPAKQSWELNAIVMKILVILTWQKASLGRNKHFPCSFFKSRNATVSLPLSKASFTGIFWFLIEKPHSQTLNLSEPSNADLPKGVLLKPLPWKSARKLQRGLRISEWSRQVTALKGSRDGNTEAWRVPSVEWWGQCNKAKFQ